MSRVPESITIVLPDSVVVRLARLCAATGDSMTSIIADAIMLHLDECDLDGEPVVLDAVPAEGG